MTATGLPRKKRQRPLPSIAGRQFKGVGELEAAINAIRQTHALDTPLRGADAALMWAYMSHHESFEDAVEIHGELRNIFIRHNPSVFRAKGRPLCDQNQIRLVFANGFEEPFTYKADRNNFGVVNNELNALRRRLHWVDKAARCLVMDEVDEYKRHHIEAGGVCEITGAPLDLSTADAHHYGTSFKWLVFNFLTSWCDENCVDPNAIEIIDTDTVGGKSFADDAIAEAWQEYHACHATLQVLLREVHLEQHKGMVAPPWIELFSRATKK